MLIGAYVFGLFPTSYDVEQNKIEDERYANQQAFEKDAEQRFKKLEGKQTEEEAIERIKKEQEHFDNGMKALDNEDYLTSLQEFYKVLEFNKDNIWAKGNIAVTLSRMGHVEEAIPIFLEQLEKAPFSHGFIEANLGSTYLSNGDDANAIKYFRKALEYPAFENHIDVFNDLGLALKNTGNYTGAKYYYEKAIEIANPNHIIYFNYGHTLNELGFHQEALDAEIEALSQKHDYYNAKIIKGSSLEYLGFFDQALKEYEEAIEIDDKSSSAFKMKIKVEEKIKKYGNEDNQKKISRIQLALFKENVISKDNIDCIPPYLILGIDPTQFKPPLELISISKYDESSRILEVYNHSNEPGIIMVNMECLKPLE